MKLIKDAKKALAVPASYLDVFTALMCTQKDGYGSLEESIVAAEGMAAVTALFLAGQKKKYRH